MWGGAQSGRMMSDQVGVEDSFAWLAKKGLR
jgi:hypothetical protein